MYFKRMLKFGILMRLHQYCRENSDGNKKGLAALTYTYR